MHGLGQSFATGRVRDWPCSQLGRVRNWAVRPTGPCVRPGRTPRRGRALDRQYSRLAVLM